MMARILFPILASKYCIVFSLLSSFTIIVVTGENHGFVRTLDPRLIGIKKEKLSQFRFYFHDTQTGRNPTAVQIVPPVLSNTSGTSFGEIKMIDNPLTLGRKLSSKLIGRAQGFYAMASQEELGLLMAMNFAFTEGKYNGSTISVLGRNPVYAKVREMPVIGGSGLFRFARGYVQARTYKFNSTSGDAIVEYTVYVLHY